MILILNFLGMFFEYWWVTSKNSTSLLLYFKFNYLYSAVYHFGAKVVIYGGYIPLQGLVLRDVEYDFCFLSFTKWRDGKMKMCDNVLNSVVLFQWQSLKHTCVGTFKFFVFWVQGTALTYQLNLHKPWFPYLYSEDNFSSLFLKSYCRD